MVIRSVTPDGQRTRSADISHVTGRSPRLSVEEAFMRRIARAAIAAGTAAAVLAPAAAQAATTTVTGLLGTYPSGRAAAIGEAGLAAGVWRSFSVHSGYSGADLWVTYTPRTRAYTS